jgi:Tol biopolymer transport system component
MFDTVRGTGARVTFDPGNEFVGVLSPDGRRMAFDSRRKGPIDLYEKPVSGAGDEIVLREDREDKVLLDWSDEFLIYITMTGPEAAADIWTLPVSGDRTPRRFLATPFREGYAAKASPNGRWIAYPSDKSTRMEVYVAPYPADPEREQQVSVSGGVTPRWGPGGQELYYFEPASGRLMVVPLTYRGNSVLVGDAQPLFKVRPPETWALWYDVTADGQRFLVNTPLDQEARSHLMLIQNWPALLERKSR